ncbi:MAG: hypothetical protein QOD65_1045 [Gaiellales bacterium]|nr:hypothetical protein [Gaiellales bacterium]MDX6598951.1 hypothetical protein [Gaiellales bacterium]
MSAPSTLWPPLPYEEWKDTRDTLHMQLQVIGKVRLALSPFEPQWANVPLYLTGRGLTTSTIPHPSGEEFDIDVDLVDHRVAVRTGSGRVERVALQAPVAKFYTETMTALERAGVPVEISTLPSEVPDPIPFPEDTVHTSYDRAAVTRFWRALLGVESVLREYRAHFRGKSPPVQLWWGTLDLAMSLFSGRPVATAPDADVITRLGGDEEFFCGGFWPGDERTPWPAFFAYMYPKPDGVERARWWNEQLGEFVLPYDDVRESSDPRRALLEFLDHAFERCWTSTHDRAEHVTP